MNNEPEVMVNPKDKKVLRQRLIGTIIVFAVLVPYSLLTIHHWSVTITILASVAITLCSLFPFMTGWRSEYLWRPYRVEIRDDGLLIHQHYHKEPKLISWNVIISLYAPPGDPAKQKEYFSQDGCLWVKNERKRKQREIFLIHWPIAIAAREKYRENMGKYPPLTIWNAGR